MRPTDRQLQLKHQQWVKMISFVLLLLSFFLGIILIENLLLSFVISIILGFLISPLVIYVERAGISPIVSILFVYCFFSILTGIFIWEITPFLVNQFVTLKSQLPDYVDRTVRLFEELAHTLDVGTGGVLQVNLSDRLRLWLENQSTALVSGIPQVISSSASVLFLSPILGFFILKDGRSFSRELLKLVPNNIFELILSLQSQIIEQIAHYIRARLIESIIVGLVTLLGFWIIGFPYAFLLAAFAAIANLIPYVGPLFGAAPGVVLALINHNADMQIISVILVYTIAQIIDNFVIIPLLVARIVNLHPITVILVVILGAQMMGILGMLISIPLASAIKVTSLSIYSHLTDYEA